MYLKLARRRSGQSLAAGTYLRWLLEFTPSSRGTPADARPSSTGGFTAAM